MASRAEPVLHRILTITDHEMARDWLGSIITREVDLAVCAEGGDLPAALALVRTERPTLIILGSPLHGAHSFEALQHIRQISGATPIVILGDIACPTHAEAALRAGARGYIHRRESRAAILAAIRRVIDGGVYLSEANADSMLRRMCMIDAAVAACDRSGLSTREREVLRLLGSGYKPGAIALQLNVSIRTVESYTGRIRQKLDIESANELVLLAVAWMRSQPG
jgi:DNA-binding NarL/FixJ family response regulator